MPRLAGKVCVINGADLTDEPQVAAMYEQVVRRYGRLDVIYNNMG